MATTVAVRAAASIGGALVPATSSAQEAAAPPGRGSWKVAAGVGLAVDGGASQHDPETFGLGTHASLTRELAHGLRAGLQWDGAWFDAKLTTEKRLQLSAVIEVDVPGTPVRVRTGPGLGIASVVDVELPPEDGFGDAQVSVGDQGVWGFVAGIGAGIRVGRGAVLEPMASLLYQRADGFHRESFDLITVVVGARFRFRP